MDKERTDSQILLGLEDIKANYSHSSNINRKQLLRGKEALNRIYLVEEIIKENKLRLMEVCGPY